MRTTLVFVLALLACKQDHSKQQQQQQLVASAPSAPGSQDLAPLAGLGAALHREAAERPRVKVTADQVFASLAAHGIALASKKQVLATTAQAAYCALGVTGDAIA